MCQKTLVRSLGWIIHERLLGFGSVSTASRRHS
jgi:hypothetical protein